jgi:hypothetical protein
MSWLLQLICNMLLCSGICPWPPPPQSTPAGSYRLRFLHHIRCMHVQKQLSSTPCACRVQRLGGGALQQPVKRGNCCGKNQALCCTPDGHHCCDCEQCQPANCWPSSSLYECSIETQSDRVWTSRAPGRSARCSTPQSALRRRQGNALYRNPEIAAQRAPPQSRLVTYT